MKSKSHPTVKPAVFGTKEWASHTVNCCTGCSHDCRYCYAKEMAVRFGRVTRDEWSQENIRQKDVEKQYQKMNGTVMFPSAHDITPNNFSACITVLEKLLEAGNRVLIVSKPHFDCVREICHAFTNFKEQVLFRFTITAADDNILSFWEPNAPSYTERKKALEYAHTNGYDTSVSMEPMLDSDHIESLVMDLVPFVSNSIWIGKMNGIKRRVKIDSRAMEAEVNRVKVGQTDQRIESIYKTLRYHPLVKWKDSIKKVAGIQLAKTSGLDI